MPMQRFTLKFEAERPIGFDSECQRDMVNRSDFG